jgi:hypothetical protein
VKNPGYSGGVRFSAALALIALGLAALPARSASVQVKVPPKKIGFAGFVRAGTWAPMRARLQSDGRGAQRVWCRWVVADADGDRVLAERRVTLSPGQTHRLWLYAALRPEAAGASARPAWEVRVVSEDGRDVLGRTEARPERVLAPEEGLIGIAGEAHLGLLGYTSAATQHEPVRLARGISARGLPDRWHGYLGLDALVWSAAGPSPGDAAIGRAERRALRRWVERGGHLVISPSVLAPRWPGSALARLLPPAEKRAVRRQLPPPWLGQPVEGQVPVRAYEVEPPGSALLRDRLGRAAVVAQTRGLGRVTRIGVNLSNPRLRQASLPNGPELWGTVFGWRSPNHTRAFLQSQRRKNRLIEPKERTQLALDDFIPALLTMQEAVAPSLIAATALFALYVGVAGPGLWWWLRRRGGAHWAWPVFAAAAAAFAALAWGGALWLRPSTPRVAHFSVLDATAGDQARRAVSFLSFFSPTHDRAVLRVRGAEGAAGRPANRALIATAGHEPGGGGGFLARRAYRLTSAAPHRVALPMRATSKALTVHATGRAVADWQMPRGAVVRKGPWPQAELRHGLPQALHAVHVVYCPGDGETAWVWRPTKEPWAPSEPLQVARPKRAERLVQPPQDGYMAERVWQAEGRLGRLLRETAEAGDGLAATLRGGAAEGAQALAQRMQLLGFYGALPPPKLRADEAYFSGEEPAAALRRGLGRALDWGHLLPLPRLIVMGVMKKAPMPARLEADQARLPGKGWTVVRWAAPVRVPPGAEDGEEGEGR